jgi:hypothetical protein
MEDTGLGRGPHPGNLEEAVSALSSQQQRRSEEAQEGGAVKLGWP